MFVPTGFIEATERSPVEPASTPAQTADGSRQQDAPEGSRFRLRALGTWIKSHWHRNSIRSQLLIIVLAIEIAAALVAGAVTILKARTSTRVEIEASTRLAELFVTEALQLVRDDTPPQQVLAGLPLSCGFCGMSAYRCGMPPMPRWRTSRPSPAMTLPRRASALPRRPGFRRSSPRRSSVTSSP